MRHLFERFVFSDVVCKGFLWKLLNTRKSYILYILGGEGRLKKTGAKALVRYPREMFYEVRIEETLPLNALHVTYPVILSDIG